MSIEVPGLTVSIRCSLKDGWYWELFDVHNQLIGKSIKFFDSKVDCYLNCAAHSAMADARLISE